MSLSREFDYAGWAEKLKQKLVGREQAFRAWEACENDRANYQELRDLLSPGSEPIDEARLAAVQALSDLMLAVSELPAFEEIEGSGTLPLRRLADAVAGLHNGHRTPFLETRKTAHRGPQFRLGELQVIACTVVEVFERTGLPNLPAREKAAALLARSGVTGRKKKDGLPQPISPSTLYKWAVEIDGDEPISHRRTFQKQLRESFAGYTAQEGRLIVSEAEQLATILASGTANL